MQEKIDSIFTEDIGIRKFGISNFIESSILSSNLHYKSQQDSNIMRNGVNDLNDRKMNQTWKMKIKLN